VLAEVFLFCLPHQNAGLLVVMVVKASTIRASDLIKFANNRPLTGNTLRQGFIKQVVAKTRNSYATIKDGAVTKGLPKQW
jgi:hypothetical protein